MKKSTSKSLSQWLGLIMMALLFLQGQDASSQTLYSRNTGLWSGTAQWSATSCGTAGSTIPTSATTVNVSCASKTITTSGSSNAALTLNVTNGTLEVGSGSTLSVTNLNVSGGTLTVNGTLMVSGTVSTIGGTINGSGTIVLSGGNQNISSTVPIVNLNISGTGIKTMTGNVTISDKLTLTAATLAVASNTLTIGTASSGSGITVSSGRITTTSSSSLSFGGSYTNNDISTIFSNTWPMTINNFTMTRNLCNLGLGTSHNLIVNGAFNLSAGGSFSIGASTLTLNGAVTTASSGDITGGTSSNLTIGGSGTASLYFDLGSTGTNGTNTINVFTNTRTSNSVVLLSNLRIKSLVENSGASITITNSSIQSLTLDGTVTGIAELKGNSNASLNILGTGALGGTITFTGNPVLSSLTMNRTSSGTATLGSALSVGTLTLTSGILTNSNLTTVTGTSSTSATGSASSYLAGPLARTIAANSSDASYAWPIGKAAYQRLVFNGINTNSGATAVIRAEAFDANSNGSIDGSMATRKTDNYWSASVTSNAGSLAGLGTISLTDSSPTIAAGDVIGYATTAAGQYTSLGGTIAAPTITSETDAPVALGFYNLGTAGVTCTNPTVPTLGTTSSVNCGAQSTTLSIATGSLNSATSWKWYTGSCGGTLAGSGASITVSPIATTTYYVRGEGGCVTAGACASITITVNTPTLWYADSDGDTFGNPSVSQSACTQPGGYVANNTDCNDGNGSIQGPHTYYVDVDGDGFTSGESALLCNPLPGYTADFIGTDCDDNNAEANSDHVEILGNNVDDNCDGATDETIGQGYILPSYCGTTLTNISTSIFAYQVPGAQGYRFEVSINGSNPRVYESANNHFNFLNFPGNIAYNTNYSIRVAARTGDFWRAYSAPCFIKTPATAATTKVAANQCGITVADFATTIFAVQIAAANQYRFEVSDGVNPARTFDTAVNRFSFADLGGLAFNTTYSVRVAVRFGSTWEGYGTECNITTPAAPRTSNVIPSQCGITISNGWTTIFALQVAEASGYRFNVSAPGVSRFYDTPNNRFSLRNISGFTVTPNTTYTITVQVLYNGFYQNAGSACTITTAGVVTRQSQGEVSIFDVKAYPNPYADTFRLDMNTSGEDTVEVKVYDMIGRQMEAATLSVSDLDSKEIGNQYPSGVYNIIVTQGENVKTLRVIKR